MIIDGSGREVGVLIGFSQYVDLMRWLMRWRGELPDYWRRALDGCLAAERR